METETQATKPKPRPIPEEHIGLAYSLIFSRYRSQLARGEAIVDSEIYSEACLGLVIACESFDVDRGGGSTFAGYAWTIMERRIWGWIRRRNLDVCRLPNDDLLVVEDRTAEAIDNSDEFSAVSANFSQLTDTQQEIMALRGSGMKWREIGDMLGFTKQYANSEFLKACSVLKEIHGEKEDGDGEQRTGNGSD